LNNASSRASPANENYARELFELHTLGADVYLNSTFDRWRDVPGALAGKPEGFIDQDVYEAARAFTGWTFANGQFLAEGSLLPNTGEFAYVDAWHDPYQKRVLAQEFEPYQAAMADGRRVLDMAAFHPATSVFVARKLCLRFVSDTPPSDLVQGAARVFQEHEKAPDQIAKVLLYILSSQEFAEAPARLQRPLFLFASMQRSAGVVLPVNQNHTWALDGMGHKIYMWHSPAGHPLQSSYWQSPGLLVRRWRMINETWQQIMDLNRAQEWESIPVFAAFWAAALGLSEGVAEHAAAILRKNFDVDDRSVSFAKDDEWVTVQALSFLAATPDYQAV
jgi:uncharacterized protein (DUF1800 family)